MHTLHKRARVAVQKDGTVRETHPAETRTFATDAELLAFALEERLFEHRVGGVPYPTTPDKLRLGAGGTPSYGLIDPFTRWDVTYGHIEAMRRAKAHYDADLHHRTEVAPQWQPDTSVSPSGVIHYADNSTVQYEIDKDGNRRSRTIIAPGGDACF